MPTTSSRLNVLPARAATPAQVNFLRSLIAERDSYTLAPLRREIDDALGGHPVRRDLIDRVLATPRAAVTPGTATRTGGGYLSEQIPTPSASTRAGRMLLAGGIEATVTMPSGQHVTIRVSTRVRNGNGGWRNGAPGEQGARTNVRILGDRVGWVNVDAECRWAVTFNTRRIEFKDAVRVLFGYAAGNTDSDGQMGAYRVQEADRCGRCMRTLTDPVSIDRGIGPECFGRDTASQHVARERTAADALAEVGTSVAELQVEIERQRDAAQAFTSVRESASEATRSIEAMADALATPAEMVEEAVAENPAQVRRDQIDDIARELNGGYQVGCDCTGCRAIRGRAEVRFTDLMDAEFAARERQQEEAAFATELRENRAVAREEARYGRATTTTPQRSVRRRDLERAETLIAEALDSYCEDNEAAFAIRVYRDLMRKELQG